ncbi:MAG: hypothetical protein V8R55_13005 [Dysosmobacter sp.]
MSRARQPGCIAAAALAGVIAANTDPAVPLNGAEIRGLGGVGRLRRQRHRPAGPGRRHRRLESSGGCPLSVVRGITTRTTTGDVPDTTWRELTTILIVDDVIPADPHCAAQPAFPGRKIPVRNRSAIRSQVIVELEKRLARRSSTATAR